MRRGRNRLQGKAEFIAGDDRMNAAPSAAASGRLLVVIVNYRTADTTIACLRSLNPEIKTVPQARVIIVDNASGDGPALQQAIDAHGWQQWARLEVSAVNGGFCVGNNLAIRPALADADPPDFVLLLNPDTEVRAGALRALVDFMTQRPEAGIAGSGLENPDGSDWPIAFRFITPISQLFSGLRLGVLDHLFPSVVVPRRMPQDRPSPVDWVSGAGMMVRRQVFETIGLLDEGYFLYFDEVDFCLRARRAGWACWYVPESRIMHIGGESTGLVGVGGKDLGLGSVTKIPRIPPYWYVSRRRYFLKNFGLVGAVVADVGFACGYLFYRMRSSLQRKPDVSPPHILTDLMRHSVLFHGPRRINEDANASESRVKRGP